MKRSVLFLFISFFISILSLSPSYAEDIELVVKSAECIDDNKIIIKYSVINYRDFDRNNVSVAFKIMEDGKPIACKEVIMTIPKNSDGTEIHEAIIETTCKERVFGLQATIFHNVKRYKIETWFEGCP
jgi:hypothetical protein